MWAGANLLRALPAAIGELASVHTLGLNSNELCELPESIGDMRSLARLLLDDNALQAVPASVGRLARCEELGLSANRLASLPDALGELRALRALRLNSNAFAEVPECVGRLQLAQLALHDNPCAAPGPADGAAPARRPVVAVLLPGLVRSLAHGAHWKRFVARYEVRPAPRLGRTLWHSGLLA